MICKLKYSILIAELFSALMLFFGVILTPINRMMGVSFLMRSHRNTRDSKRQLCIESLFKKYGLLDQRVMLRLVPNSFANSFISPSRVFKLKEMNGSEKGVLLIKYNGVFSRLSVFYDIKRLQEDYYLILEPSYSGYCSPEILQFADDGFPPVLVESAESKDFEFLQRMDTNLIPIDIGSSNWVDDRVFVNLELKKEFDCIMVALWGDIKRHYLLFESLKMINDKSYRVCLLGGAFDRNRADIEEMADFYGVRDNLEIHERLSPHKVNEFLNKSKVNVLLTLKEGANKSLFEGFFANVPGLVLKENVGVNKSYFNQETGRVVAQRELTEALLWFRDNYMKFQPREWALENISPKISTAKIEEKLRAIAAERGEPWSRPLVVKVNRPECEYYNPEEALPPLDLSLYSKH